MTPTRRSTIVTTLLLVTVASASPVLAGGNYGGHGYGHGGYGGHGYGHGSYGGHGYGHGGYRYRHGGYYYGGHHGYEGIAAAGGLVFGLVLASTIHDRNERRYRNPAYYDNTHRHSATRPRVQYRRRLVNITQRPAGPCLQEREYQTHVTVNGRQVDAYGTACLQRDGSWRQGPSRPVPQL